MTRPLPPDQQQRIEALDITRSVLVQAPAGSGKTDLLTRRFLRLLAVVDDPSEIVAITFTKAAAAEMRHRILSELEKASLVAADEHHDVFSMPALAARALARSRALGWQLPDLASQLQISTIDSFCRNLAIQQPLLTGLGSRLDIAEQPAELYRRAARAALERIDSGNPELSAALERLLLWRDNGWFDLENLLVEMLSRRDRWMHEFVLSHAPDWDALRAQLERPFVRAVATALTALDALFDELPRVRSEALALARFADMQLDAQQLPRRFTALAELPEFPTGSFDDLDAAHGAFVCLADLVLIADGAFRSAIDKRLGFPADRKTEKSRLLALIDALRSVDGLESALAAVRTLPPPSYTEDDWQIIRACFTLLRQAVAELHVVFASAGAVDFIEVAQIAQRVLVEEDGTPSDAALNFADGIRHLLVDEFQDTSRRQHRLLASIAAAWPDPTGRTLFVVGDPMQSIYFFRDADAELFPRVRNVGLDIPGEAPLPFHFVPLSANFRTAHALVDSLNHAFESVFTADDRSGIDFSSAAPARDLPGAASASLALHLDFVPQSATRNEREAARDAQAREVVAVIESHLPRVAEARARGDKYRIAVLGRARSALIPVARALREAGIPFLAVELEHLQDRPEVLDALALGRALLNPLDRVAWLSVLRAPWCGLPLADLHALVSADDDAVLKRPIPELLTERLDLVSASSRTAVQRVLRAIRSVPRIADALPTSSLGTWFEQVWLSLGGPACVDATERTNLDLLWDSLDTLPNGAQDLLSSTLDSALAELTARPDAAASADCGVQLMTIHKSKGLEFEAVFIPDLQARGNQSRGGLLSWLERGLAEPDEDGAITEFLIAPLQSKGSDAGPARKWVDSTYRARETQEMRRILYVAATRAREELHFFARPAYKQDADSLTLVEPSSSLLATAWPALEQEVHTRFATWQAEHPAEQHSVETLAASQDNLLVMPSPDAPTLLRRLPEDFDPRVAAPVAVGLSDNPIVGSTSTQLYTRHEGGLLARVLGTAVHTLLEEAARARTALSWEDVRAALQSLTPRLVAQIRSSGVRIAQARSLADEALAVALDATRDPHGQWILDPHKDAASEVAWAGYLAGAVRTVRVDRLFRAGAEPLSEGTQHWWIVDYKTTHANGLDPGIVLPELRQLFAPQLETYAALLRKLHGADTQVRAALYYPRMLQLDWWEIQP
ncbi:MAG: UvrD-helicase domain-containing protein [Terracidiphilus sp.]|nr:UvrD-helicase domain-containing protein [Terracidiphilus sp.]